MATALNARARLEQWVTDKLDPLTDERRIIIRDPQRMICPNARAVDGWAFDNKFQAMVICSGNLAFRRTFERIKNDATTNLLLVDQTRDADANRPNAPKPLYYPDLMAQTKPKARLRLDLRDFLIEATGDSRWPELVNQRLLSGIILENLDRVLRAYDHLRRVDKSRFTDTDLYKIILGAVLGLDPFRKPDGAEIRKLCLEQYERLNSVRTLLPTDVCDGFLKQIASAEAPFCWYMDHDPALVNRAFILSLILSQHDGHNPQLLIANFDPALTPYREIKPDVLKAAGDDLLRAEPERLAADVEAVEKFLRDDPKRIELLLGNLLKVHSRDHALKVLRAEKFSPLVRSAALGALLADLLSGGPAEPHRHVREFLQAEEKQIEPGNNLLDEPPPQPLVIRRPAPEWNDLKQAYYHAHATIKLLTRAEEEARTLTVMKHADLKFEQFDKAWREDGLGKLDFYLSDLERIMRLEQAKPLPDRLLYDAYQKLWARAREMLAKFGERTQKALDKIHERFQDLYRANYVKWIADPQAPMIFTSQFVPRFLKSHWDPKGTRKAYLLIFDGMRVDAWQELLKPLMLERFEIIEERPASAILPTETQLTRKAISAGCMPDQFTSTRENALLEAAVKKHMGCDIKLDVVTESDDVASGMSVRYRSDNLEVIIFGFTDKNLHNNDADFAFIYKENVRAIIAQDVRSVLRQIEDDALIFITSDHGFAATGPRRLTIPDANLSRPDHVNYMVARLKDPLQGRLGDATVQFTVDELHIPKDVRGVPFKHLAFPRPGQTLQRPQNSREPDRYTHGGLSPAECLIPMVCLGPKRERSVPITMDSLTVEGSLMEGEEAILVMAISGSGAATKINIEADQPGIVARTEVFAGPKTYRLAWKLPTIEKPTSEEQESLAAKRQVTVTIRYEVSGKSYRSSKSVETRILLERDKLRRPGVAKLDAVLGLMSRKASS